MKPFYRIIHKFMAIFEITDEILTGKILINNYEDEVIDKNIKLKPYQSIAIYCD